MSRRINTNNHIIYGNFLIKYARITENYIEIFYCNMYIYNALRKVEELMIRKNFRLSILFATMTILAVSLSAVSAQENPSGERKDMLTSQDLEKDGQELNKQILTLNNDIQKSVKEYKLLSDEMKKGISVLPYQTSLRYGSDNNGSFMEIERHQFMRNPLSVSKIIGVKTKSFKLYYSGDTVNKILTQIFERYYDDNSAVRVNVLDPTPSSEGTDDVTFTHTVMVNYTIPNEKFRKNINMVDNKALKDIQNTTAFPIRNDLRRNFLIPNLVYVNNVLLDIAETYYKGKKDSESLMTEFLKRTINY